MTTTTQPNAAELIEGQKKILAEMGAVEITAQSVYDEINRWYAAELVDPDLTPGYVTIQTIEEALGKLIKDNPEIIR